MSYPDDMRAAAGRSDTMAEPGPFGPDPVGPTPDAAPEVSTAARNPSDVHTARLPDGSHSPRADHDPSGGAEQPDVVERFTPVHQRTRLIVATAIMSALTLLLVLITMLTLLAHAGDDEPVIVDGVPCLVQDGEGDQAVLYCQR